MRVVVRHARRALRALARAPEPPPRLASRARVGDARVAPRRFSEDDLAHPSSSARPRVPPRVDPAPTAAFTAAAALARSFASSPPSSSASSDAELDLAFHRAADELLGNLQDAVEAWGEDADVPDFDYGVSDGVASISLGPDAGTYVINKQGPNRQIWMSSPVSGPLRYDYDAEKKAWVYRRDGHLFHERLRSELVAIGGGELDLEGLNE
jgi:frataxin